MANPATGSECLNGDTEKSSVDGEGSDIRPLAFTHLAGIMGAGSHCRSKEPSLLWKFFSVRGVPRASRDVF